MGRVESIDGTDWVGTAQTPKLSHAAPVETGQLSLAWTDGFEASIDLRSTLETSPSALVRSLLIPEVFIDFEVQDGGGAVRWINGVDFCADALRLEAETQAETPIADLDVRKGMVKEVMN